MASTMTGGTGLTSSSLYAIQEEESTTIELPAASKVHIKEKNGSSSTKNNKPTISSLNDELSMCERINLTLLKKILKVATIVLSILTLVFALVVSPLAIYLGRPKSTTKLKHAITSMGGKFITWGKKNELVSEYFVYGSKDENAEVLVLWAGGKS